MTQTMTPSTAVMVRAGARRKRALADEMETLDPLGARWERREADEMETRARDALVPATLAPVGELARGLGGEMLPIGENAARYPGIVGVIGESPDLLVADASLERLRLTGGALTLAVEAAMELKARDPVEKMLAHEMAGAHRHALRLAERASGMLDRTDPAQHRDWREQSQEAARLTAAGARMMAAVAGAALALQRLRAGDQQMIQVVHQQVAVADGGRAVVAGQVGVGAGPRKRRRKPRRGGPK